MLPILGLQKNFFYLLNMSAKVSLENVKRQANEAQKTITQLKDELQIITEAYNTLRCHQLREENKKLLLAVEATKKNLVNLEIKNGVKQVGIVLNKSAKISDTCKEIPKQQAAVAEKNEKKSASKKKTEQVAKPKNDNAKDSEEIIDVGRLDLRIGKIEHVKKHPDADSLYVLKISCGEDQPRTVCSGLVKFVPIEQLENKSVMLLCNLKPAKMRGVTSEAMIMCASCSEAIEVLSPPPGCIAGEAVHCEGYTRNPDLIMNPKKKIFEAIVPDLATNETLEACYKGAPFYVPGKGKFLSLTLKNCPVK
ncbi:aminoacyl tRNA synthase complex-interacting multifunctional protein 1-like [Photinus pyralis]|uniref:tRNA-binding domain-containing protein n=2 Tax=Photinus pyralis TaxID=7054 RepID=A0A1Y1MIX8_PHOPY|nr:aminoacyl tRNA synthase complex-interacting multifunctional protein 1-like [Photinus pyralis]